MAKLVSTDSLKDALAKFRERGDERWASKSELPDIDTIKGMVSESLDDLDVVTADDVGGLSYDEMIDILSEI